jgi:D-alanyl-D-alanine carboxypeptidase
MAYYLSPSVLVLSLAACRALCDHGCMKSRGLLKLRTKQIIQTFCLLLLTPLFSACQTPHPETPAGRQLAGWLAAFDGTNWDAYREFLSKNFASQPKRALLDPAFRDHTGGFDLKKIEEETPTKVTALLQERASDGFARIELEIEAAEPHRIVNTDMHPIDRPAEFALPHMSDTELIAALRKKLEEETAADKFAGAVLVAKNGKPIFGQAYGLADREHKIPNTLETRFSIASMNKMITAVATMQLVQAGKLNLDDPLAKYLPGYPNKELATKVTIGELLTNTGGTGDIWGPEFDKHRLELRTLQDYVNLYGNRPLRFEPGSRWEYTNFGFILLGAVIEKVSGENYYDYVRKHIYIPAGMTSTGSDPEDKAVANRNIGYTRTGNGGWQPNTAGLMYRGTSAGGGDSTVADLLRFANALRENRLLDAQHTKLLTTGKVATPFGLDAYGFGVQTFNGIQCFGHNGGGSGVNGDLEMCLDSTYTVVALANMDPPAAERVSQFIISRLPAAKPN